MVINWQLWNKPETGGVIGSLVFLVGFCFFLFMATISHYNSTQGEIALTASKMKLFTTQIEAVETYDKLSQQEAQKFGTFKRKKWILPLTQDRLNQALYSLQKQANVEFLFIQPKPVADPKNITKVELSLNIQVLRDQSFFSFLQKLETELPGIVKIKKFELKRARELSPQLTQKVSEGEKVSLFEGNIELEVEYAQFSEKTSQNVK